MLANITISLVRVTPCAYILWRYWDSILVPGSGPSQELICQEARNHFPDSTLFPKRSRVTRYLLSPTPAYMAKGSPYTALHALKRSLPQPQITRKCMFKPRSFNHKTGTRGKIISFSSLLSALLRLLALALGKTKAVTYTQHTKCGSYGKESQVWLTRQGLGSWGCSEVPCDTNCFASLQASYMLLSKYFLREQPLTQGQPETAAVESI